MYPGTHAAVDPDRPAVVVAATGETMTYGELDGGSARLARWLGEQGLRRGDVIALLCENTPRFFEVYWAALRSGLYVTAVNWHLAPSEVAYIVKDSGAAALVVSGAQRELAEAIVDDTPALKIRLAFGGSVVGYADYDETLRGTPAEPLAEQPRGRDMLYSSGTTGRPKGIKRALPDRQVDEPGETDVAVFGPMYGFGEDTVFLSPAPLYHSAPSRFSAVVHSLGGTVVLMDKFDAEQALHVIDRYRVTHSQWVPTMFVRLLKLPEDVRNRYDLSGLRVAIHAAAPCPVDVKRAMIEWWGPILFEFYSATESHGITFIDSEEWLRKPGSVGRGGVVGIVHICADDGTELPPGEVGTVYFERDDTEFAYHNDPGKTQAVQHPEHWNWRTTGDIGYLDSDGYLFLTDRKAFMIISGGVNIYPQEIEDCLVLHPKVFDVAVIGVPDPEMGESVAAFVQLAQGVPEEPELAREFIDYCRGRIAHYKAPRTVQFVKELPRTQTGKLAKHRLRDQLALRSV